jgi:diguanylate cyclase
MVLGYVLLIRNKHLLLQLNAWIVLNYTVFTFFFTEKGDFSVGRLIIRLTLIVGTALLLERYSRMLTDLETLREKAVKMAMFDPLTGAYNRRILDVVGDLFSEDAMLYFVMIDIDNFKAINDNYGHQRGDEVLVSLTEDILKIIGEKNMCIRYGGEEFLLVIEENDYSMVHKKIQKIQDNFGTKHFTWSDRHISFSFTAGISSKNKEADIKKSIEWADKALYYGKNNGKNCIILSDQSEAV